MRRKNESVLLALIRRHGGLPSADLARRSGFAPQTVSVLLRGLEQQGVVVRGEVLRGRRGQPAVPMLLNPEGGYGIGVELGWRHIDTVLVDLRGQVLALDHVDLDYTKVPEVLPMITASVEKVTRVLPEASRKRILGLGLAKPSKMFQNIHLLGASDEEIEALEHIDVVAELQKRFDFPVFCSNDGTLACRAEAVYGQGAAYGDTLHIFIGTYVAAGIYVDGHIVEGIDGNGANFGSSMVPAEGGELHALHLLGSVRALEERIQAAGKQVPRTDPAKWDWDAFAPELEAWLDVASAGYAVAIVNSSAVVGFGAAIIDGVLPDPIIDDLIGRTAEKISSLPIMTFKAPHIIRGSIGAHAPAIGAADIPLYAKIFSPEMYAEHPGVQTYRPT